MSKTNVMRFLSNMKTSAVKHSPEILTGIGLAGMVTTVILAVGATPKAMKKIEEKKDELDTNNLTAVETVQASWKQYVPAAVTGIVSVGCIIGAQSINAGRNAALATAYQLSTAALKDYKAAAEEVVGEEKAKEIREKSKEKTVKNSMAQNNEVINTGRGDMLCYELSFGRFFNSDIHKIKHAVNELNRRMTSGMEFSVSLNEFYNAIGLSPTPAGDTLGWNVGKIIDIEYDATIIEDDKVCLTIEYLTPPDYDFNKYY